MIPTTGSSPSPRQLDDLATQLQECARQLRALLPDYTATLRPVLDLDDSQTWNGSYPGQASAQINGWQKSVASGHQTLLALAGSWDSLAQQILRDAAELAKAEKANS